VLPSPIPDSYWVVPGNLLAGEYPGASTLGRARTKLRQLLEIGITYFLDLTEEGEHNLHPYAALLRGEASALGRAVEHHRMPIPDVSTPTKEQMARILDAIDAALAAGQIVYLHCYGGIGRTGTVVGCYLVRRGMDGEAALAHIARLRQGTPDGRKDSPETPEQCQMVREWASGGC
jgi:protein-tyrosine phosphatase